MSEHIPDQYNTNIDYVGDVDTYDVYLTAGSEYDLDVYGWYNGDSDPISPGFFDPTLTVYNPDVSWASVQ